MNNPYQTPSDIHPCLAYDDAPAAIEWLCRTFGFTKEFVVAGENNRVEHSELSLGTGVIMVGSVKDAENWVSPKHLSGKSTQALSIYVPDPDRHYQHAVANGAKIIQEIKDEDYGARGYGAEDPEGHQWYFGNYRPGAYWERQNQELALFHSPHTRSSGVLILLEELAAEYRLQVLNMKAGEQHKPEFLAINPMGKVPAVRHGEALITEQVAVYIYLADLFPDAGLAPTIGDPLRGPYLRWMGIYGSCFEPAMIDRSRHNPPAPQGLSPYGDFETLFQTLTDQLSKGDYLLGAKFTAVDVLWATALTWMTQFQLVPTAPVIQAYIDRVNARPAVIRAKAKDAELAAGQD